MGELLCVHLQSYSLALPLSPLRIFFAREMSVCWMYMMRDERCERKRIEQNDECMRDIQLDKIVVWQQSVNARLSERMCDQ